MPTIESTDLLARTAHHGQVDKAGKPYIDHPRAVAESLRGHGDHAVMAGLLHDVVEDTHITLDDLRELGYPDDVVSAVDSVTRRPGETYMDMVRRAAADPLGWLVKLADNTHNSHPDRLALLDADSQARLAKKYAKARVVLLAAGVEQVAAFWDRHLAGTVAHIPDRDAVAAMRIRYISDVLANPKALREIAEARQVYALVDGGDVVGAERLALRHVAESKRDE